MAAALFWGTGSGDIIWVPFYSNAGLPRFLSDLLYNDYSAHGDNTEDEYNAIFQNSSDGWDQAMATIYTLCQDKLTGSAKDVLEAEQQQWLDMREQMALNTPIFLVTDMTKMRTYDLISLYFEDHFYDWHF